jgi:hypothetical protein
MVVTTQYHYPLAPLNYALQLSSILVVLISVIIKIVVVLQKSADNADVWPYDLDYVAVTIPPTSWSTGQDAAWFLLQALNNGLSNVGCLFQFMELSYNRQRGMGKIWLINSSSRLLTSSSSPFCIPPARKPVSSSSF